jgi:hypothetical protein
VGKVCNLCRVCVKTDASAVLSVMSGAAPHMISVTGSDTGNGSLDNNDLFLFNCSVGIIGILIG